MDEPDFRVELRAIQLPCKVIQLVHLCQITKNYCNYSHLIVFINLNELTLVDCITYCTNYS